jgi:hypothetical protein
LKIFGNFESFHHVIILLNFYLNIFRVLYILGKFTFCFILTANMNSDLSVAEENLKESLEVMYSDVYKKLVFLNLNESILFLVTFELFNDKGIYVQQIVAKIMLIKKKLLNVLRNAKINCEKFLTNLIMNLKL